MTRILVVCLLAMSLLACSLFRSTPSQDFFVLFFVPGTTKLAPEAEQIVRQASGNAKAARATKIVIAIPPDTPGGVRLVEGRRTAVENILSAAGTDTKLYSTVPLADAGTAPQGAIDRAEIWLVH
jgi:membrane-bound ClpP family serine protease